MQFSVGPYIFRVLVVFDLRHPTTGDQIDGLLDTNRREIYVNAGINPDRRIDVILHELQHAWEATIGEPPNEEWRCDIFAMICRQLFTDLGMLHVLQEPAKNIPIRQKAC